MNKECFPKPIAIGPCKAVPVVFLSTEINGVDDRIYPPENGAYRNTIVTYTKTKHVYLFDSAGVPIQTNSEGVVDEELLLNSANPVENRVIAKAIADEAATRDSDVERLQADISAETEARESDRDNLQANINAEVNARISDRDNLQTNINMVADKANENAISIERLEQSGLYRGSFPTLADAPTTQKSEQFIGGEALQNDFVTIQEATDGGETGVAQYRISVQGDTVSYQFDYFIEKPLKPFSNDEMGLIQGSVKPGELSATADGKGAVNGWGDITKDLDDLHSQVNDNAGDVAALDADKLDQPETQGATGQVLQLVGYSEDGAKTAWVDPIDTDRVVTALDGISTKIDTVTESTNAISNRIGTSTDNPGGIAGQLDKVIGLIKGNVVFGYDAGSKTLTITTSKQTVTINGITATVSDNATNE